MSTLPHTPSPPLDGTEITEDRARVDVDVLHPLLAASYWSPGVPRHVVEAAIAGSDCFSAHRDGVMIGFARLVTDRATFGWVADVVVVPEARGQGVGTALMRALLARAESYQLRRTMLATRDAHDVYRPLGFTDPPAGLLLQLARDPAEIYAGENYSGDSAGRGSTGS